MSLLYNYSLVQAIKNRQKRLQYDTEFVISEVSAEVRYHFKKDGKTILMRSDSETVGGRISTKAVGSNQREDLTLQYKYSDDERSVPIVASFEEGKHFKLEAKLVTKKPVVGSDLVFEIKVLSEFEKSLTGIVN